MFRRHPDIVKSPFRLFRIGYFQCLCHIHAHIPVQWSLYQFTMFIRQFYINRKIFIVFCESKCPSTTDRTSLIIFDPVYMILYFLYHTLFIILT